MKTILLFLIAIFVPSYFYAQSTYVPDAIFETYLETHDASGNIVAVGSSNSLGNGVSNDNYVDTNEISIVTFLDISNLGIADLTGIEDFLSLDVLHCGENNLTNINVSQNTTLTVLDCNSNQLTSLNVSTNTSLSSLNCDFNQLTSLDVSSNLQLEALTCQNNTLNSLDLTHNTQLRSIDCSSNVLSLLNLDNGQNADLGFNALGQGGSLECIQVTDPAFYNTNWSMSIDSNSYFTSNCNYDDIRVPDDIFEAYLETHDQNGNIVAVGSSNSMGNGISNDGFVLKTAIETVTNLDISNLGILDLTGIEGFTALQNLYCGNNFLSTLNIDFTNNTHLQYLDCNNSQIDNLNISGLASLQTLICNNNNISTIDLSTNTSLVSVNCSYNQLSDLYISFLTSLQSLICNNNQITSIQASTNTNLNTVICNSNSLVYFDIRNGNNTNITNFNIQGNPNLTCIFVDNATDANSGNGNYVNWLKDSSAHYVNDVTACNSLSVESTNFNNDIKFYPNPVKDILNINSVNLRGYKVCIYDFLGKKLIEKLINKTNYQLDVSNLKKGVYFINIKSSSNNTTYKFLKS